MSDKISFRELVEAVARRSGETLTSTDRFVRQLTEIIESGLKDHGIVTIANLGKFERRWIRERTGVHPQTGERIIIPAHHRVVFKPFKALREHINLPYAHLEARILDLDTAVISPLAVSDFPGKKPESIESVKVKATDKKGHRQDIATEGENKHVTESDPAVDTLWQGEVVLREVPKQPRRPASYFVELDEESAELNDEEELMLVRPSPLNRDTNDTIREPDPTDSTRHERLRVAEKVYWSVLSIIVLISLLIWFLFQLWPSSADLLSEQGPPALPPAPVEVVQPGEISAPNEVEEREIIRILVEEGETLWSIAGDRLENSYLWPWIYHLNRKLISKPDLILAGSRLYLPRLGKDSLNERELRIVANSYLDLYRWQKEHQSIEARHYLWAAGSFCPNLLDEIDQQVDYSDLKFARNR